MTSLRAGRTRYLGLALLPLLILLPILSLRTWGFPPLPLIDWVRIGSIDLKLLPLIPLLLLVALIPAALSSHGAWGVSLRILAIGACVLALHSLISTQAFKISQLSDRPSELQILTYDGTTLRQQTWSTAVVPVRPFLAHTISTTSEEAAARIARALPMARSGRNPGDSVTDNTGILWLVQRIGTYMVVLLRPIELGLLIAIACRLLYWRGLPSSLHTVLLWVLRVAVLSTPLLNLVLALSILMLGLGEEASARWSSLVSTLLLLASWAVSECASFLLKGSSK